MYVILVTHQIGDSKVFNQYVYGDEWGRAFETRPSLLLLENYRVAFGVVSAVAIEIHAHPWKEHDGA